MRQARPVRGHAVETLDRAHRDGEFIGARVAHHADALHWQQHREALPDALVPPRLADLLGDDGIRLLQQGDLVARDAAQDADREAGPREGLADQEFLVDAEVASHGADFVLEQFAERLHQLELHTFRQAADVVMALDGR